jgi:hypothetical protein
MKYHLKLTPQNDLHPDTQKSIYINNYNNHAKYLLAPYFKTYIIFLNQLLKNLNLFTKIMIKNFIYKKIILLEKYIFFILKRTKN